MRIAVVNWSRRKAGGVETYLGGVVPELLRAGHEVAFWHERDAPLDRERIPLPEAVPVWSAEELGGRGAIDALKGWRPDLLYSHGMLDTALEAATLRVAPAVFFAHGYYGTCISGSKTFKSPVVRPCERSFGWRCLVNYYPRRCGGWSPVSMFREYWRQAARLELLRRYDAIVTHSGHIQAELIRHGLSVSSAYKFPYYVHGSDRALPSADAVTSARGGAGANEGGACGVRAQGAGAGRGDDEGGRHLLFIGRMDLLKGGGVLLDALPEVREALGVPLRVTFAGDGPARRAWERRAARVEGRHDGLRVEFAGWLGGGRVDALLDACDLLVLPSLWPEPFGLVGPEAGLRGVPVAAFAVGGVRDWLIDGVNGYLAPGDPPTTSGLAAAIVKCLADPVRYASLSRGAVEVAQRFSLRNHLTALLEIFESVAGRETRPQHAREAVAR